MDGNEGEEGEGTEDEAAMERHAGIAEGQGERVKLEEDEEW